MVDIRYRELTGGRGYWALFALLALVVLLALATAAWMAEVGHHVTGMGNHVVWGVPHVFAIFLIVAASGALNVASIASVFGRTPYKPLGPLSGLLAMVLLIGGLVVLVLDLGRPDRLIVAMTRYNFSSIFAWNIFLYTGFLALVAVYLWTLMDRPGKRYARAVGTVAFLWRIVLTTGTGSIFGFLVAREAYDAAILAPLFVVLSLALGTAAFLLVLMIGFRAEGRPLGFHLLGRLRTLLGIFVAALLYFVATHFVTLLYASEHHGILRFLLLEGDGLTQLFWVGQIAIGGVLPLLLLFLPRFADSRMWLGVAAALVLLGGWVQVYVLLIGGQAYPLDIFPGMEVSSRFMDGAIQSYAPAWPEFALGLGGVALSGLLLILAMRVLRFLPEDLADERVDPHARSRVATTPVTAE